MTANDYSFRFDCGFNKPVSTISFADTPMFLKSVWLHFIFYSVLGELEQFKEGFRETLQMEHLIQEYPEMIRSLLVFKKNELTAGYIQDLFHVQFSSRGSNDFRKEETVVMHWYCFLMECEGMFGYNVDAGWSL